MPSCRDDEYCSLHSPLHLMRISLRAAAATWLFIKPHDTFVPLLEEYVILQKTQESVAYVGKGLFIQ